MKTILNILFPGLGVLLITHSLSAQSWEAQGIGLLPVDYGVFCVSVVNENVVWGVALDQADLGPVDGEHLIKVLKTIDGGETWEVYEVEEAHGRMSFDIVAFDHNTAFITTQDNGSGAGQGIFKTEDGGDTWTVKLNGLAGGVWIRFFNIMEGVAINHSAIKTTSNGGDSWTSIPSANIPDFIAGEFTGISNGNNSCHVIDDHIWFGTTKGRIFRSQDKGQNWEVFNSGFGTSGWIESIVFKDTLNGIVQNGNSGSYLNSFRRTSDGGETWQSLLSTGPPGTRVSNIAFLPSSDNTMIGLSSSYVPSNTWSSVYSTDFGESWNLIDMGTAFGGTHFISPNTGWTSIGTVTEAKQPTFFKWDPGTLVTTEELIPPENFTVFPNPFTSIIYLESENEDFKIRSYKVYELNGKLINSGTVDESHELNFDGLNPGVYHLELSGDEFRTIKKIVKVD